jgi:Ras-related protein Rab-18
MERWFEEAEANAMEGAVMYLVGSKLDRAGDGGRKVSREEGEELARKRGAVGFEEVSSKTRENVRKVFLEVVDEVVKRPELIAKGGRRGGTVSVTGAEEGGGGCAC